MFQIWDKHDLIPEKPIFEKNVQCFDVGYGMRQDVHLFTQNGKYLFWWLELNCIPYSTV